MASEDDQASEAVQGELRAHSVRAKGERVVAGYSLPDSPVMPFGGYSLPDSPGVLLGGWASGQEVVVGKMPQVVRNFLAGDMAMQYERAQQDPTSTDALYGRYQALVQRASQVFGDDTKASAWLSMPSADLDGEVPLKVARRDGYSLRSLEPIFVRIEHGINF